MDMDGGPVQWEVADGAMTVVKGTGDIVTREKFEDIQLHIEWRSPKEIESKDQGRGNSGIFLQSRYEVQVLDSYQNRTYSMVKLGRSISNTFLWLTHADLQVNGKLMILFLKHLASMKME